MNCLSRIRSYFWGSSGEGLLQPGSQPTGAPAEYSATRDVEDPENPTEAQLAQARVNNTNSVRGVRCLTSVMCLQAAFAISSLGLLIFSAQQPDDSRFDCTESHCQASSNGRVFVAGVVCASLQSELSLLIACVTRILSQANPQNAKIWIGCTAINLLCGSGGLIGFGLALKRNHECDGLQVAQWKECSIEADNIAKLASGIALAGGLSSFGAALYALKPLIKSTCQSLCNRVTALCPRGQVPEEAQ